MPPACDLDDDIEFVELFEDSFEDDAAI